MCIRDSNGTKALKGVSMRIDDGEFVFLVGPSGSGKSTIIKLITGEIATTEDVYKRQGHARPVWRAYSVPPCAAGWGFSVSLRCV